MIEVRRAEGSRADLVAKLRNVAEGCLGSVWLRNASRDGAEQLEAGAASVRVGHTDYIVTNE